jgi:hypothetical protein
VQPEDLAEISRDGAFLDAKPGVPLATNGEDLSAD